MIQNPPVVEGFRTDLCDHDKFANQAKKYLKCLHRTVVDSTQDLLIDYHDQLLENNYVYDISNATKFLLNVELEGENCQQNYMRKCFNDSPSEIEKEIFKSITQLSKSDFNAETVENWQTEIENKLENLTVENFIAGLDKEDIVKRDHECLDDEWKHTFENDLESRQCNDTLQSFTELMESLSSTGIPQHFSICTTMANSMGACLRENNCISQREVELTKHVAWAAFQIPMDAILKIRKVFGSFDSLLGHLYKTTFKRGNKILQSPRQPTVGQLFRDSIVLELMNWIIDDYETPACKAIVDYGLSHLEVIENKNLKKKILSRIKKDLNSFLALC